MCARVKPCGAVRAAAPLSLSLSLSFSLVDSSPPTVNDAFYAGVKTLLAKTTHCCAAAASSAATAERAVMIPEMIYCSLVAREPPPLRAPTLQQLITEWRSLLCHCLYLSIYRRPYTKASWGRELIRNEKRTRNIHGGPADDFPLLCRTLLKIKLITSLGKSSLFHLPKKKASLPRRIAFMLLRGGLNSGFLAKVRRFLENQSGQVSYRTIAILQRLYKRIYRLNVTSPLAREIQKSQYIKCSREEIPFQTMPGLRGTGMSRGSHTRTMTTAPQEH